MVKRKKGPGPRKGAPQTQPTWWNKVKEHWKIVGPTFIVVGMQLMSYSAIVGVLFVYGGIIFCMLEVVNEQWLIDNDYKIQVIAVGIIVGFFSWFTITTFPIPRIESNAAIAPHRRNPKVSELHVVITNGDDDEYEKLNLIVKPGAWVAKTLVVASSSGCEVKRLTAKTIQLSDAQKGTDHITYSNVLGDVQLADENGATFSELAAQGSYQIYCSTLPPKFTVRVVFGIVEFAPQFESLSKEEMSPGSVRFADIVNSTGAKVTLYDMLGDAPCFAKVVITGTYKYRLWTYGLSKIFNVNKCPKP